MKRVFAVDLAACALLLIQYLLGMVVNVFTVLPGRHPGASAGNYFSGAVAGLGWVVSDGPGWAAAHAAFGMALAAAAIAAVLLTWRKGGRVSVTLSVVGALAVIGAGFNGVSFLNYGKGFSSMIMAGLWALALACYVTGALIAILAFAQGKGRREGLEQARWLRPRMCAPWRCRCRGLRST
jgi:hypothetical protein